MKRILILSIMLFSVCALSAQQQVKNIIFMIGDGMGLAQVSATALDGGAELAMTSRAQYCGFVQTISANSLITDSAAAATALATGTKSYNGAIGVDVDKKPLESILHKASKAGFATGLVATYSVTNATPAGFIARADSRKKEELIAEQFLDTDINVFMGGGKKFFEVRTDNRNISEELRAKGYTITHTLDEALNYNGTKLGALLGDNAMQKMREGRGDYLPKATAKALELLSQASNKGFFIMVEGSMIDGGGHANDAQMVRDETRDFDAAVKVAFDFADKHPGTLVVVTADHETGGMTLTAGDNSWENGGVKGTTGTFSTKGHTACFVPLFAYGTGAQNFSKMLDNTDIPKIMEQLLLKK